MTKIVEVSGFRFPNCRGGLNVRQLLNLIFFLPINHHPNMTRQRRRKQRAKDLTAARRLKGMAVPLDQVDTTVYLVEYDNWLDREVVKSYDLRTMIGSGA